MTFKFHTATILLTVFLIFQLITACLWAEEMTDYGYMDEQETQKPRVQGKFHVKQTAQAVNEESRLNLENEVLDLPSSVSTLVITSQISDFIDQKKSFHWMFKAYGYSEYGPDNENSQEEDLLRIDELFLDWANLNWFISLGKRRNTWGTTSVWNPLNVVVPSKDPLTTEPQTEGHPNLLINYANEHLSFDLVFTRDYDRDWDSQHDRWGTRFSLLFDDIELGLYYFDGESFEEDEIAGIRPITEYDTLFGLSYSSNFFDDATLYAEIANFSENIRFYFEEDGNIETKEENVFKAVLGSVITLDGDAKILLEIYHNSAGYTEEERKNYFSKLDSTLSYTKNSKTLSESEKTNLQNAILYNFQAWSMNQNYILFTYSKSFWEKYNMSLNGIMAEDESFITTLSGSYHISDYYLLEASFRFFSGDIGSEFANVTYSSTSSLSFSSSF